MHRVTNQSRHQGYYIYLFFRERCWARFFDVYGMGLLLLYKACMLYGASCSFFCSFEKIVGEVLKRPEKCRSFISGRYGGAVKTVEERLLAAVRFSIWQCCCCVLGILEKALVKVILLLGQTSLLVVVVHNCGSYFIIK